jgi:hypothetical protein
MMKQDKEQLIGIFNILTLTMRRSAMIDLEEVLSKETMEKWLDAQATLKAVKEEEMELRKSICLALQQAEPGFGTKSFHVHGFDLSAAFGLNYKLDEEEYIAIASQLSDSELECIKVKFVLDVTKFKAIDSDKLASIVTVTESAPTLKVK